MDKNESVVLYNKGAEAWNAWAKEMLDQQIKLKEAGKWMPEYNFVHKRLGENAATQNWLVDAKSDFTKQIFENVMDFRGFIFPGDAAFTGATFGGDAKFDQATFSGEADFDDARFRADAYFWKAMFGGDAGFVRAAFGGEASFEKATFSSAALFMDATFGGFARFEEATFSNFTAFVVTTFESEALFRRATFSGMTSFQKTIFSAYIGFEEATFGGNADFRRTTFSGDVKFKKATFSHEADFEDATFSGYAKFWKATIRGEARFEQVKFGGEAEFTEATFEGDAWFGQASFRGNAVFQQVAFGNYAGFRNVLFVGRTSFCKAKFGGDAEFHAAQFVNDTVFTQAIFAGSADFFLTTFQKEANFVAIKGQSLFTLEHSFFFLVPDFGQAHFAEAPQLHNSRFDAAYQGRWWKRQKSGRVNTDVTARWRTLKRLAVQGHDHERELMFMAEEIKSSRGVRDRMLPNPINFLKRKHVWPGGGRYWYGLLYQGLSDFGRSTARPLSLWVIITAVFALGFHSLSPHSYLDRNSHISIESCSGNPVMAAIYLSVNNGLVISGLGRSEKLIKSYVCLYGSEGKDGLSPIMPDGVVFAGLAQTIISAVLIFLFLFGLRNYFRIK